MIRQSDTDHPAMGLPMEPRAQLQSVPNFFHEKGILGVLEPGVAVPFQFKRFFFVTGVPSDAIRGGHAHLACHQFIVCLGGRLHVGTEDRVGYLRHDLSKPDEGLYVPPMTWVDLKSLSSSTSYVVAASHTYDASDYLRDQVEFRQLLEPE